MTDYGSIQRYYDEELKNNSSWSVYVFGVSIPYFNTYLPARKLPHLTKDEIGTYLANMLFIYENDLSERSDEDRLVAYYDLFAQHFTLDKWLAFCDAIIKNHRRGESEFTPNANAASVKNPYFKFDTRLSNPEKQAIRNKHRRVLRNTYKGGTLKETVYDILADYDLNAGRITKGYIYNATDLTRYFIDEVFRQNPDLVEMYETLRLTK